MANITTVFKNDVPLDKLNDRPFSTLPLLSKVYEKLICNKVYELAEKTLNCVFVVFGKSIVHNMNYLSYYSRGNKK